MGSQMRIGFACKFVDTHYAKYSSLNFKSTTARHLASLDPEAAREKLRTICEHNLRCLSLAADVISVWPAPLRMFRMSGDLFPLFTHEVCNRYYTRELYPALRAQLPGIGDKFRAADIRVSFHPGQYTLLGTAKEEVVKASVDELEYHAMLLLDMGYSGWHDQGCAINIHGGSKAVGLGMVRRNLGRLTPECLDFLTIENDEFSYGLTQLVEELGDVVAILPDLHHHWIHDGYYLPVDSPVLAAVEASWKGVRPKMHCSCSPAEYLYSGFVGYDHVLEPVKAVVERTGATRAQLRQHAHSIWHTGVAEYYGNFIERFDIMVEAKGKHCAAGALAVGLGIVEPPAGPEYLNLLPEELLVEGGAHQSS